MNWKLRESLFEAASEARLAARVHGFTPVYGDWPVCDLCGEREHAPIHEDASEPSKPDPHKLDGWGYPDRTLAERADSAGHP